MKGIGEGKRGKQTFSFTWISLIISIAITTGTILFASCTKTYEFSIGTDFIEARTKLQVVDTFRVDISTILQDSIVTSSTETIFTGNYEDTIFGALNSDTYFELGYENFADIDEKAIYDSSAFIFSYSGVSYGDTTSLMSLSLHALTENIKTAEYNYIYNNASFEYDPEPVGSLDFYPSPNSEIDTAIFIQVNELGEELFNLIRDNDEAVSSEAFFSEYLKGFILTQGTTENKAIIGFKAGEGKIVLKIYYHLDREEPDMRELVIKNGSASKKFNNTNLEMSNTMLSDIKAEGNILPFSRTDYKGYMQGLTGLMTKIDFPTLQDIFLYENWKVLKAELVIEPVKNSFDIFSLPKYLYIYQVSSTDYYLTLRDERGNSIIALKDDEGNNMAATFEFDEVYGEKTSYTFDITSFINNELANYYYNYKYGGLYLSLSYDSYTSSFDRLIFEGKKPPVKLRLYYLSY